VYARGSVHIVKEALSQSGIRFSKTTKETMKEDIEKLKQQNTKLREALEDAIDTLKGINEAYSEQDGMEKVIEYINTVVAELEQVRDDR
jgi:Asp/Glu/hydantoin racemase